MRILFLSDNHLPHFGGSRVYNHNLLKHLGLARRDTTLLTRRLSKSEAFDREQPYVIRRCKLEEAEWLRPLRLQALPVYLSLFWHALLLILRRKPDVLIAGELLPTGFVGAAMAAIIRRPFVVITHSEGPMTLSRTRYQSRLARWVCRRAAMIVVSSAHARDCLVRLWEVRIDKIAVVHPGVGEQHFDERYRAHPMGDPSRAPRLLCVGRLVARKGHQTLLEALPRVMESFPNLQCVMVGEGPENEHLAEAIEQLGLGNTVEIARGMADEELMKLYAKSDLFVLPIRENPGSGDTEGFGIVFAEAGAHGLPVIGGIAGGTVEAIADGETGLLVNGNDPVAVGDAISRLLQNGELARTLGENGRQRARQMHWEECAKCFKRILDKARFCKNT